LLNNFVFDRNKENNFYLISFGRLVFLEYKKTLYMSYDEEDDLMDLPLSSDSGDEEMLDETPEAPVDEEDEYDPDSRYH